MQETSLESVNPANQAGQMNATLPAIVTSSNMVDASSSNTNGNANQTVEMPATSQGANSLHPAHGHHHHHTHHTHHKKEDKKKIQFDPTAEAKDEDH